MAASTASSTTLFASGFMLTSGSNRTPGSRSNDLSLPGLSRFEPHVLRRRTLLVPGSASRRYPKVFHSTHFRLGPEDLVVDAKRNDRLELEELVLDLPQRASTGLRVQLAHRLVEELINAIVLELRVVPTALA